MILMIKFSILFDFKISTANRQSVNTLQQHATFIKVSMSQFRYKKIKILNLLKLFRSTHHININSEPTDDNHVAKKSYVDSLSENDISRQGMSTVFNYQVNEFDNNISAKLDSITINRKPLSNEEQTIKK